MLYSVNSAISGVLKLTVKIFFQSIRKFSAKKKFIRWAKIYADCSPMMSLINSVFWTFWRYLSENKILIMAINYIEAYTQSRKLLRHNAVVLPGVNITTEVTYIPPALHKPSPVRKPQRAG